MFREIQVGELIILKSLHVQIFFPLKLWTLKIISSVYFNFSP